MINFLHYNKRSQFDYIISVVNLTIYYNERNIFIHKQEISLWINRDISWIFFSLLNNL